MASKTKSRQEGVKQQKLPAPSAPTKSSPPSNKRTEKDSRKVTVVNEYIEYDNKLQLLYTRKAIAKGTRIFVECPLFMIGVPPIANHPGNILYAYEKFKKDLSPEKQSKMFALFHASSLSSSSSSSSSSSNSNDKKHATKRLQKPEMKKQEGIETNIAYLQTKWQAPTRVGEEEEKQQQKQMQKQTQVDANKTKKPYHDKDWEDMSRLAHVLHYYSINLQYVSPLDDEMNTVDKFQLQWFDSKTAQPLVASDVDSGNVSKHADSLNHRRVIGRGIFEYTSHLSHSCVPTCQVNVIDEKGTVELRLLRDIPKRGIILSRNYLDNLDGGLSIARHVSVAKSSAGANSTTNNDDSKHQHNNGKGNSNSNVLTEKTYLNSNVCGDLNLISCRDRCERLLRHYHILCQCVRCQDWDKLRGFRCSCVVNSNNCQGILWSKPPYLVWQCQECQRYVEKEALQLALEQESKILHRMRGIDALINYRIFSQTIRENLYVLLNEASLFLARNHWIIIYLLWICFEEKFNHQVTEISNQSLLAHSHSDKNNGNNINLNVDSNNNVVGPQNVFPYPLTINERLQQSWIYLRRHVELCQSVYNYPNEFLICKLELLSDLLPNEEIYKFVVLKQLVQFYTLTHGEWHTSTKRAVSKLRIYERWMKSNETKKEGEED